MFVLLFAAVIGFVSCQDGQEVAFSAGLTHHQTIQHAEKVVFDRIYSNIGAAYNSASGNFNCPVSGYYVFQCHTMSRSDKASWLELYHNSQYVASIYGHSSGEYANGGNSVILKLTKGDQVFVRAVDSIYGYDTNIYGQPNEIYSTFSGYMVSPIYEDIPAIG